MRIATIGISQLRPKEKHGRKAISCFRRGYDLIRKTLFDYTHPLQSTGKCLENIIPSWRKRQKIIGNQNNALFRPVL